jgi:MFS transporter, DHA1 family, multidrug resistance protein
MSEHPRSELTARHELPNVPGSATLILMLVLATALGPLAMSSFIPAIPSIQGEFAVPTAVAQLTLSVSLITMALSSLLYGTLADRYGRKPVLLIGIALAVLGSVISALAPSVWIVIAGRGLQAAGATAGLVLARVIVRDVYGDERASSLIGYITAAMALAPLIGPIIGGHLIDAFGWRSVFVAVGLIALWLVALLSLRLPETAPFDPDARGRQLVPLADYGALLLSVAYLRFAIFGAAMFGIFMAFISGAPYVAMDHFGLSASAYGWYFMIVPSGYLIGSLIAGRWSGRWNRERLLLITATISLALCGHALWMAVQSGFSPWQFFIPMAVLSAVIGAVLPSAQVGMLIAAGPLSGTASGLFSFLHLIVGAGLAQLVGTLLPSGPHSVALVMLAVAVIGFASAIMRRRAAPRPSSAEPGHR